MREWIVIAATLSGCIVLLGCRIDPEALEKSFDETSLSMEWSGENRSVRVSLKGSVDFNEAETSLDSLSAGGRLEIEEVEPARRRQLEVTADRAGQLSYSYRVDGETRDFDAEGREWFALILPRVIRETGFHAQGRVERILGREGNAGVLSEISRIESDNARRVYLETLVGLAELSPEDARRLAEQSDSIASSAERQRALSALVKVHPQDNTLTQMLVERASHIRSSWGLVQVLSSIIEERQLSTENLATVAGVASQVSTSFGKSSLLIRVAESTDEASVLAVALDGAASIEPSFEKRRCLESIVRKERLAPEIWAGLAEAATGIRSTYEKSNLLVEMAARIPISDVAAVTALLNAAGTVESTWQKARILEALGENSQAPPEVLDRIRDSAETELPAGELLDRVIHKLER